MMSKKRLVGGRLCWNDAMHITVLRLCNVLVTLHRSTKMPGFQLTKEIRPNTAGRVSYLCCLYSVDEDIAEINNF